MLSSMIGAYDPRLVVLSAVVSLCAAYTTLEIIDHISFVSGWRRFVWTFVAALTSVLTIWSMQCIVTLSLHKHVILSYDLQVETASFAIGFICSLLGATIINARSFGVSRIAIGGTFFGLAMVGSDALGVRAMQLDGHTAYRYSMFIAGGMIALCSAMVALMIGSRLQRSRSFEHIVWRFSGSLFFLLGSMACYFYLMSGVRVSTMMPFLATDPAHTPLALALGLATSFIVIGALAAVWLDDQASSEHQRAYVLSHLYTRERHVSATLQKALLPASMPVVPGISFSSVYLPHSHEAYVGGDWYDAFMLSDGRIAFSMGDVAGHGLGAALTMNVVRHALRACAVENATPSLVLARANRILLRSDHPAIVTAVFAILDPVTLSLEFASAGHPAPLVIAPTGKLLKRVLGDAPIGIYEESLFTDHLMKIPDGSMIVSYTDGCTEYDRDLIRGERRFGDICSQAMKRSEKNPAEAIADRLFAKRERNDDAAIFCIQIENGAASSLRTLLETVTSDHVEPITH